MRIDRQNVQPPRSLAAGLVLSKRFAAGFRRDEDGAILLFSLFMFMMILFIGGIGVDLMRFETERAKLQSTLDRAVLAAADIEQVRQPKEVVEDYFAKSGFTGSVGSVTSQEGLGFRSVSATASKRVGTHLIHMLGVDSLTAPAAGAAEERVDNVEISLVLDVSGSMASNQRIENLRTAGGEFIDAIFANAEADKISVSLVPYNGQVNIGPNLITKYTITDRHNDTFCVDLPDSAYNSISLPRDVSMPQHAVADTFNSSNQYTKGTLDYYGHHHIRTSMTPENRNRWCDATPNNQVRIHSNNVNLLKNQVNALQPNGATSIDAGMRWGTALLDPSSRSVVTSLISENVVAPAFNGRPLAYSEPDVLKVIVLMTDGEHWPNEYLNDGFRSGTSTVFINTSDSYYSILHGHLSQTSKYWIPHLGEWSVVPWGGTITERCTGSGRRKTCTDEYGMGTAVQLTWPQVWQQIKVQWAAYHLYSRALSGTYDSFLNMLRTREGTVGTPHEVSKMNNRLLGICNRAKQQGIVIYTIAFEAPSMGRTLLQNCASSINHAFDVDGLEISSAFASIATSIRKLRLTQ